MFLSAKIDNIVLIEFVEIHSYVFQEMFAKKNKIGLKQT